MILHPIKKIYRSYFDNVLKYPAFYNCQKKFTGNKSGMGTFKISSSHGYLIADSETGIVKECRSDGRNEDYLPNVVRFDVDRYKKTRKTNTMPDDVDILRLGYYNRNGSYDTPAEGYEPEPDYALCEAIADITFIAAKENYETEDSRKMISQFIQWANDFEYLHKDIIWGINSPLDYLTSIHYFTLFKINQWRDI